MQNSLLHRVVILIAFLIASIVFVAQMALDYDLLEAAYTSACVMMAASIVLLIALQSVVRILFEHLSERTLALQAVENDTHVELDDQEEQAQQEPERNVVRKGSAVEVPPDANAQPVTGG